MAKSNNTQKKDIAVVGIACRFPCASDYNQLWNNILNEKNCIGEIPQQRWDINKYSEKDISKWCGLLENIDLFDHHFFNISGREARNMDPQQRILLQESWRCIEDSGIPVEELQKKTSSVYIGAMTNDYLQEAIRSEMTGDSYGPIGNYHCLLANRISFFLGLSGESQAVDAAHASSLVALNNAIRSLRMGDSDYAIVGAVNINISPWKYISFSKAGMLSPVGQCKSFDKNADGYVPGDGVGVILIRPLSDAIKSGNHIYSLIKGIAVNHGGHTPSLTAPRSEAQAQVLLKSYKDAQLNPGTVSYIEAHATGTQLGDVTEIEALSKVFKQEKNKEKPFLIGSVKPNIGHLEAASGMAGLIKVLLMMREQKIPPTINLKELNPKFKIEESPFSIPTTTQNWEPEIQGEPLRAGVSSFGFGGTNAHLVLESFLASKQSKKPTQTDYIFMLSSKSSNSLNGLINEWKKFVFHSQFEKYQVEDICATLMIGRQQFAYRYVLIIKDKEELKTSLLSDIERTFSETYSDNQMLDPGKTGSKKLVELWCNGQNFDWQKLYPQGSFQMLALPAYCFDGFSFWLDRKSSGSENLSTEIFQNKDLFYQILTVLQHIFAEKLQCNPCELDSSKKFVEYYGVDSFMNTEILDALEQIFGILSKTLLFEYNTIDSLASYFLNLHKDGLNQILAEKLPITEKLPIKSTCDNHFKEFKNETIRKTSREKKQNHDIAIIGLNGIFPKARHIEELWKIMVNGEQCITEVPVSRWDYKKFYRENGRKEGKYYTKWGAFIDDYDKFDPLFFGISPHQAEMMDPQQRIFLEVAYSAVENAGYIPKALPSNTGVFVGVSTNTYGLSASEECPDTDLSDIANRVSYFLDLHGPSMSVDTACSSSLTAVHIAIQSLLSGEIELALAGGVSLTLHPNRILQFCQKRMLLPNNDYRPFGTGEGGFVDGEGAVAIILKPLDKALEDNDYIYGIIKGSAINTGGKTSGYTVPNPAVQTELIIKAFENAAIDPRTISYIEAHGTGTKLGDPIEIEGLTRAFRQFTDDNGFCAIGSIKSNIGHLIAAAGIAGLAKVLLQIKYQTLVPSVNAVPHNPYIDFKNTPFIVQEKKATWNRPQILVEGQHKTYPLRAGISSFGSGGSNAHIIVEEPPIVTKSQEYFEEVDRIIILSAKNKERLKVYAINLLEFLSENFSPQTHDFASLAYTLQIGRVSMEERLALVAKNVEELKVKLTDYIEDRNGDLFQSNNCQLEGESTLSQAIKNNDLKMIAQLWTTGLEIDWQSFWEPKPPKMPLPTYPFARERYWLTQQVHTSTHRFSTCCFFKPQWVESPVNLSITDKKQGYLVFDYDDTHCLALKEGSILVKPGSELKEIDPSTYEINPVKLSNYLELFDILKKRQINITRIIHMWSSYGNQNMQMEYGPVSIFLLAKSLISESINFKPNLLYIYSNTEKFEYPQLSAVSSLLTAITLEVPSLVWKSIEIQSLNRGELDQMDLLLHEWDTNPSQVVIRYQGKKRYVRTLKEISTEDKQAPILFKENGIYLITGGMGGLGKIFSQYLLSKFNKVTLILIGRTELNDERKKQLASYGAEVVYFQTDVSNEKEVLKLHDKIINQFGKIDGIIHAAGIKKDALISSKPLEEFYDVIAPKVQGTIFLDEAFKNEKLDFFVMFSSIASLTLSATISDYAYANCFLDSYAQHRESLRREETRYGTTLSVNWPLWLDGGMEFSPEAQENLYLISGMNALPTNEGLMAWEVISNISPQCVLMYGDETKIKDHLKINSDHKVFHSLSKEQGETLIKELISQEIKLPIEKIDTKKKLVEYGFDSIVVASFTLRLEKVFGPISRSLLLEYDTVDALAHYFSKEEPSGSDFPLLQMDSQRRLENEEIAVIGMAGRYPEAVDLEEFWDNLSTGNDSIDNIPSNRWDYLKYYDPDPRKANEGKIYCKYGAFLKDVDKFDPLFFDITPLEAKMMCPEERLLLETSWTAVEDAGYLKKSLDRKKIGVFIGVNSLTYPLLGMEQWQASENISLDTSYYSIPNRISYFYNLTGPSIAIDTGCSSSLVALHMACDSIRNGESEAAMVGGVNLYFHPSKYWLLCRDRMLSTKNNCRFMEKDGDGFIPGEGVGVLIIKPLSKAIKDQDFIYGIIKASSVSHKGKSNGFLQPSPTAQAALINDTMKKAAISPKGIDYVEVQGLGSEISDSAEWSALMKVHGTESHCAIGSLKPNIGHLEAASGIAQITKVLLQLKHRKLTPTLVADKIIDEVDTLLDKSPFYIQKSLSDWENNKSGAIPKRAGIYSTAAGGSASYFIIEEYLPFQKRDSLKSTPENELVILSAKTSAQLKLYTASLENFLIKSLKRTSAWENIANIAYTLQTSRKEFRVRVAFIVESKKALIEALNDYLADKTERKRDIIFEGSVEKQLDINELHLKTNSKRELLEKAASLWTQGANIDWLQLKLSDGFKIPLPTYPFEKRRCWLYDSLLPHMKKEKELEKTPLSSEPGAVVADYYNKMTEALQKQTLQMHEDLYILFAPFPQRRPNFSWVLAFFEPKACKENFDYMVLKQKELKSALYRHVDFNRVNAVMDIGCGIATDLIDLAHKYPKLKGHGFTITPKQATLGIERIKKAQLDSRLKVFCKDSTKDEFLDLYDLIIGFEVVFHIQDKDSVFANISRHLKPDGFLILADGITTTVTEVNRPQLAQFTITAEQFSSVLAQNGLKVKDCIDVSNEISNFLYDPHFEENLEYINKKYPDLRTVENEHRCWLNFGKTLGIGILKYLLFTIIKADPDEGIDSLIQENHKQIQSAQKYSERLPIPKFETGEKNVIDYLIQENQSTQKYSERLTIPKVDTDEVDEKKVEEKILKITSRILEIEEELLVPEAIFKDYGVGSLQGLMLIEGINRELKLKLMMPSIYDYPSIRKISKYIAKNHIEQLSLEKEKIRQLTAIESKKCQLSLEDKKTRQPISRNERIKENSHDIAVIGMSCRYPGAKNVKEFWTNLNNGRNCLTEVPRHRWNIDKYYDSDLGKPDRIVSKWAGFIDEVDRFDADFFKITPQEAEMMDPQQRIFLEESWRAIENAGYNPHSLSQVKCGIYVGLMGKDYKALLDNKSGDGHVFLGNSDSILPSRIAYFLNLKGPALSIKTACSSSLIAVHLACNSLASGETDMMLAGGITLYLNEKPFIMMSQMGMLSPTGKCRVFDDTADGIAVSEGVGIVVLKSLDKALNDGDHIYGIIKGSGMNQNGKTNGMTAPCSDSQSRLEIEVYEKYNINPETISYVEAHGTGTPLGDPIEIAALKQAFSQYTQKKNYCGIGSVKSNIGHTTAAAGVASLIKVLLSLRYKQLPPTLHFKNLNKHITLDDSPFYVNTDLRPWKSVDNAPLRATVSSFGFNGTNCHMVVEEALVNSYEKELSDNEIYLIPLSAQNTERLFAYAEELLKWLEDDFVTDKISHKVLGEVIHELTAILGRLIGIVPEDILPDEELTEYCLDLYGLNEFCHLINMKYDRNLKPDIFLTHNSIQRVALYLAQGEVIENNLESISDIAFTLQTGRTSMQERVVFVVGSTKELINEVRLFCLKKLQSDKVLLPNKQPFTHDDLIKFAQSWVNGTNVDWNILSKDINKNGLMPRRVPLPSYPFFGKKYWVTSSVDQQQQKVDPVESSSLNSTMVGEKYIIGLISEITKLPINEIDPNRPFEDYGIDSMFVMRFNRRIEEDFGPLSKTLLYEYQNVHELTMYFMENYKPEITKLSSCASDKPKISDNTDIAIIGLSGRYPGAETINDFWKNLRSGKSSISEIPSNRWNINEYYDPDPSMSNKGKIYCKWGAFIDDVDKFDTFFFNISPKEAQCIDPQERIFLETTWAAFEDAGYTRSKIQEKTNGSIGVFAGVTTNTYQLLGPEEYGDNTMLFPDHLPWSLANRVSYFFNLNGPSMPVDTACSSSLTAIHLACESLKRGECLMAIAGGVNLYLHPTKYIALCQLRMLSQEGRCAAFGNGDGFVPGEGVGVVVLKSLKLAERDGDNIYAIIKGSAINHDGKTNGYTVPNPNAQAAIIQKVLESSHIQPRSLSYIEAHGTGTALGDPIEITGLSKAFQNYVSETGFCAIGSVKSNIGHLESAAGIAGVTKILLQMRHKEIAPSINALPANANINFSSTPFFVQNKLTPWEKPCVTSDDGKEILFPRRAGISSFGAGGANAHIIIEEYDNGSSVQSQKDFSEYLVVLSAETKSCLFDYTYRLKTFLSDHKDYSIFEISYTLLTGREHLKERLAIIANSTMELIETLNDFNQGHDNNKIFQGSITSYSVEQNLLDQWIKNKNLKVLAESWVKGVSIEWTRLFSDMKLKCISLPTYPFAKESYWISNFVPHKYQHQKTEHFPSQIHPFIGSNLSTFNEYIFKTKFNWNDFYLRDHLINNMPAWPGVAFIEMAHGVAKILGKNRVKKIANIVWPQLLTLAKDKEHTENGEVFIQLYPGEDRANFEVYTVDEKDIKKIHSQGKIIYDSENNAPRSLDLKAIQSRMHERLNPSNLYMQFKQMEITHGPVFQIIKDLYKGKGDVLSRIEFSTAVQEWNKNFYLNPVIMDATLQTVLPLIVDLKTILDIYYLPFSIGEVNVYHPTVKSCFVYATYAGGEHDKQSELQRFNMTLMDERGLILAEIKEFVVKMTLDDELYFKQVWQESPVASVTNMEFPGALLLLDTTEEIYSKVKNHVILIKPTDSFKTIDNNIYGINPEKIDDYITLCKTLRDKGVEIQRIIHFWSKNTFSTHIDDLRNDLSVSVYSIFWLFQALISSGYKSKILFLYASLNKEKATQPHYAGVSGLLKTLHLENPNFSYKTIEFHENDRFLHHFSYELQEEISGIEVLYNTEGKRLVKHNEEFIPDRPQSANNDYLQENNVYLITGGLGGLGLKIAEHLVKKRKINLILVGRSEISTENAEKFRQLQKSNSTIQYMKADISKRQETIELIQSIRDQYPKINGLFHCAGVIRDSYVLRKKSSEINAVLGPKVFGTINLDETLKNEPLDFFIMFSSTAAILGNPGQSDYAFGNGFMDHFARWRHEKVLLGKRQGRSLSINWPLWSEGGMRVDSETERLLLKTLGMKPMKTATGLRALDTGLSLSLLQFSVIEGDKNKIRQMMGISKVSDIIEPVKTSEKTSDMQVNNSKIFQTFQEDIVKIAANVIKADTGRINAESDMADFGFNSINLVELSNFINTRYSLEVMPSIFFEHRTIASFSNHLFQEYSESLFKYYEVSMPEIETPERGTADIVHLDKLSSDNTYNKNTPIAIIGLGTVMPQSKNANEFWQNLADQCDLITEIPIERWDWREIYGDPQNEDNKTDAKWGGFITDVDKFDARFFGISPKEAKLMDPQHRIFLEVAWQCIEDAGYRASDLAGSKTGVFVGIATHDYHELLLKNSVTIEAHTSSGLSHSIAANRLSYLLDLKGPSEPIDTACSSSLVAIHRAVEAIQSEACEMAIVGGINLMLNPMLFISFSKAGMLSKDGRCKTFDEDANGYVRGEGAGAVLLKPLNKAITDGDQIYAVIRGSEVQHAGHANSLTAPNPLSEADTIATAIEKAGVSPNTITYIEVHGTGTNLGDPVEINGLKIAFKQLYKKWNLPDPSDAYCGLGSVKTNIGHLETGAGIAGIIKVLLSMKYGKIPASINFKKLNPYIQIDKTPFYIVRETSEWKRLKDENNNSIPRRAGVSSFSFGGVNAHVVLEEFVAQPRIPELTKEEHLIVLSAKDKTALQTYAYNLREFLKNSNEAEISLQQVAYTLQVGREPMPERLAVIGKNIPEITEKLDSFLHDDRHGIYCGNINSTNEQITLSAEDLNNKNFDHLAQLWVCGCNIDWKLMYPHKLQRISLPTYPFARKRHWCSEIDNNKIVVDNKSTNQELKLQLENRSDLNYIVPVWEEMKVTEGHAGNEILKRIFIVYTNEGKDLAEAIAWQHPLAEVIKIKIEETNNDLFSFKKTEESFGIYFLGAMTNSDKQDIDKEMDKGLFCLFRLVKSLLHPGVIHKLKLKIVVNDVEAIFDEKIYNPIAGSLHGFMNILSVEYPNVETCWIEIVLAEVQSSANAMTKIAESITLEPWSGTEQGTKLYKGKRFVKRLRTIIKPDIVSTPLQHKGCYLIAGGAGGIGFYLSCFLSETLKADIVWIGRRPLNNEIKSNMEKVEALGGGVLYLQADITDLEAMQMAVKTAKTRWTRINGAIHSAVALSDKTLEIMTEEDLSISIAAKTRGCMNFAQALSDEYLDFMVFFSSMASFFGNIGTSNYAAGNTFMDAYALYFNQFSRFPVKVINWGYWGNIGVGTGPNLEEQFNNLGLKPIGSQLGVESFQTIVSSNFKQIILIRANEELLTRLKVDNDPFIKEFFNKIPNISISSQIKDAFNELDHWAKYMLLKCFQKMGVFQQSQETFMFEELCQTLRIIPGYFKFFDALLEILAQAGFIVRKDKQIKSLEQVVSDTTQTYLRSIESHEFLKSKVLEPIKAHINLLDICINNYPGILRGEVLATDIMFPLSSMELVEGVYKGNILSDWFNQLMADLVQRFVQERIKSMANEEKISIIELGAGTGGTSEFVLEALAQYENQVSYIYSDISPGFTLYGKNTFKEKYPFTEFKLLNIEKSVTLQKFETQSFDLVLATNVIHATSDLRNTLNNIKELLKPGACLLINEATAVHNFATLCFGTLDGWWLSHDPELRLTNSPLLNVQQWQKLLIDEGFNHVIPLGGPPLLPGKLGTCIK